MLDYALNRLSVDMRSDLTIAIQDALLSGVFTPQDIKKLDLYLQGYTASEIAIIYTITTNEVEETLERIFTAIEELSGYDDDLLIRKVEANKQYRRSGISELRAFLTVHGKHFMSHGVEI